MKALHVTRRGMLTGAGAAATGLALGARGTLAQEHSQALAALIQKAAGEAEAVWYESSRSDLADQVLAAFRKAYPNIRIRHESVPGGNGVSARLRQESMAGAKTADLVTVGAGETSRLLDTDLVSRQTYADYGVDPRLVFDGRVVNTAVTVYCIVYNKTMVSQAPTGWDDLVDPKYKGNVGTWVRAAALAELSASWGEQRVLDFYNRLLAQQPMFFNSNAPLAQAVASGEIALGLGSYHDSLPPLKRGAPIDRVALNPTPVSSIVSFVTGRAASPAAATLFISWLASPPGNAAYESIVGRGSALISTTATSQFLKNKEIAEWPVNNKGPYAAIFDRMNRMVAKVKIAK